MKLSPKEKKLYSDTELHSDNCPVHTDSVAPHVDYMDCCLAQRRLKKKLEQL